MISRFYIIDSTDPNLDAILAFSVQKVSPIDGSISARKRKDGEKMLVYLYPGDTSTHEELLGYVEYNLEQIKLVLDNDDWTGNLVLE